MYNPLKEEAIVNKVGGRFKLSTLLQKRLVQLNAESKPLVALTGAAQDNMEIALQEILADKIRLDTANNLVVTGEQSPVMLDGPDINPVDL